MHPHIRIGLGIAARHCKSLAENGMSIQEARRLQRGHGLHPLPAPYLIPTLWMQLQRTWQRSRSRGLAFSRLQSPLRLPKPEGRALRFLIDLMMRHCERILYPLDPQSLLHGTYHPPHRTYAARPRSGSAHFLLRVRLGAFIGDLSHDSACRNLAADQE